jgi:hypothetical protein
LPIRPVSALDKILVFFTRLFNNVSNDQKNPGLRRTGVAGLADSAFSWPVFPQGKHFLWMQGCLVSEVRSAEKGRGAARSAFFQESEREAGRVPGPPIHSD